MFIFGEGGSIGLVEYISIAIAAMTLTDNGCCWQGVITCSLVDLGSCHIVAALTCNWGDLGGCHMVGSYGSYVD